MSWNACYNKGCELEPEDPALVEGPEVGSLMRYIYKMHEDHEWNNTVVKVVERSYVWSPEIHKPNGYHGYRHYEWSVVEYRPGHCMVVDDVKLFPLELGEHLVPKDEMPLH